MKTPKSQPVRFARKRVVRASRRLLPALVFLLALAVPAGILAAGGVDAPPASGLRDGGGFPSPTPTTTPVPTATPTTPPAPYPLETPEALLPDQDFLPAAEPRSAPQTASTETSPSFAQLCLPFAVALILVVVVLTTWLRRRGHSP